MGVSSFREEDKEVVCGPNYIPQMGNSMVINESTIHSYHLNTYYMPSTMLSALDALSYLIPTATFVVLGATIILNFTVEERVLARLNNMPKVT